MVRVRISNVMVRLGLEVSAGIGLEGLMLGGLAGLGYQD